MDRQIWLSLANNQVPIHFIDLQHKYQSLRHLWLSHVKENSYFDSVM